MKTTPISVKFDRQGHSCNFYAGFGPTGVECILSSQAFRCISAWLFFGTSSERSSSRCCVLFGHLLNAIPSVTVCVRYLKCVDLSGQCWAEIQQLALTGSSSSLHSEACNALGASDGVIHSSISSEVVCLRATANNVQGSL